MKTIALVSFILFSTSLYGQILNSGFDKSEYMETLKINHKAHIAVEEWGDNITVPDPEDFAFTYRSPRVAFDNIWDLWIHKEKQVALIAVQGSVPTGASFLANLYPAMIPATGELQLDEDFVFKYKLAENENAAVHVGWLVAMAYLSETIEKKIDSCYKAGIKDFILTGHSQGGGITFLLTAYLEHLKLAGKLPQDIQFKTYCSAAPKPGNLYFAYDYEKIKVGGWAYNVVNTIDWVPDVPFSIQTVDDFTTINPFKNAKTEIKKMKFPKNIGLKYVYNQLSKPGLKAQKKYEKYLGEMVSEAVKKQIPNFNTPSYYKSNYYVRTGNIIVLQPDEDYLKIYNNDEDNLNIWQHHLPQQYLLLTEKLK
ncbi:lipase family protein [Crocinitomix catalasitica]|uniref:lipase family protein n=1 Tax=Crocinitomix catalasitica TaxID=184607 RepID=UPI000481551B|nr:lipase family protein [Crocinitomix catalasitica]